MITGVIYCIACKANGCAYIGSTLHEEERISRHLRHLKKNKHFNKLMQEDYNKYGKDQFYVEILHRNVPENLLHDYEKSIINDYKNDGFNLIYNTSSTPRISAESRKKLLEKNNQKKIEKINKYQNKFLTLYAGNPLKQTPLDNWISPSDCGDNSCLCVAPKQRIGMRTNGGCRCDEKSLRTALLSLKQFLMREFNGS